MRRRSGIDFPPNDEQICGNDLVLAGHPRVLGEAGAGTGKTTFLQMLVNMALFNKKGQYMTFSRSLAEDAQKKFPKDVCDARTAHGVAWKRLYKDYASKRHGKRRMRSEQVGQFLGMREIEVYGFDDHVRMLSVAALGEVVMTVLRRFVQSDKSSFEPWMVHPPAGCDRKSRTTIYEYTRPFIEKAWQDIVATDGVLPFNDDHYMKIWALSNPRLEVDYILFDEAQDASAAMADLVEKQTHCQLIFVGDSCQSIYGWRGAVNAMDRFGKNAERFSLQQSYRFGDEIASEANRWLRYLRSDLVLRGNPKIHDRIGPCLPDAILCRTNAGMMIEMMGELDENRRVAFAKKKYAERIEELARAAIPLKAGGRTSHPELCGFKNWSDLKDYANNEEEGRDLKAYVDLIDNYGVERILALLREISKPEDADVVISTAHGAKGREWKNVKISSDFTEPQGGPSREDAMLAYVTLTRAKTNLDRGSLRYIDRYDDKTYLDRVVPEIEKR